MLFTLTSRDSGDAVSMSLSRLIGQGNDLAAIDVADLVRKAHSRIAPDGSSGLIFDDMDWQRAISQAKICINRALINNKTLTYSEENARILQTDLEAYLRFYINRMPKASARAGMYGLCGDHLPLYMQWQRVKERLPDCLVPRYHYAFGSAAPNIDGFTAPIYKSVYDFRAWKQNAAPEIPWHVFVVDRPTGQPLIAAIVGDRVFFSALVEKRLQQQLDAYSVVIARAFGSEFGEILYFVDGDRICFAAHSHVIKCNIPDNDLDEAVMAVVNNYLQ